MERRKLEQESTSTYLRTTPLNTLACIIKRTDWRSNRHNVTRALRAPTRVECPVIWGSVYKPYIVQKQSLEVGMLPTVHRELVFRLKANTNWSSHNRIRLRGSPLSIKEREFESVQTTSTKSSIVFVVLSDQPRHIILRLNLITTHKRRPQYVLLISPT
ncbi:hypothetical protein BDN70DRAFT_874221 [Pholiota conissans]|uniref:Uncharacterized protein n=1 Tax=Pholiota conissans TaxID=109636 RepID=A0A9P5Z8Z1_9AGAR|nr:hypothetical protein BDN70DRAFT_874221 [Pholiota conissans]